MSKNLENYVKSQEDSFIKEITDLKENVSESKKMPEDFSDFVKECERKNSLTDREFELYMDYMRLIAKYKGYGKLKVGLYNLTSLTDKQAESLSEV